jgi:predicted dehydrogenase
MSLDVAGCKRMIDVAEKSGKVLQIGHCVRFWPEYAKAKQLISAGRYGKVLPHPCNLSSAPTRPRRLAQHRP